jgi:hypothetical protein
LPSPPSSESRWWTAPRYVSSTSRDVSHSLLGGVRIRPSLLVATFVARRFPHPPCTLAVMSMTAGPEPSPSFPESPRLASASVEIDRMVGARRPQPHGRSDDQRTWWSGGQALTAGFHLTGVPLRSMPLGKDRGACDRHRGRVEDSNHRDRYPWPCNPAGVEPDTFPHPGHSKFSVPRVTYEKLRTGDLNRFSDVTCVFPSCARPSRPHL